MRSLFSCFLYASASAAKRASSSNLSRSASASAAKRASSSSLNLSASASAAKRASSSSLNLSASASLANLSCLSISFAALDSPSSSLEDDEELLDEELESFAGLFLLLFFYSSWLRTPDLIFR